MTEQTRSLPTEILLLISDYYDVFHVLPEHLIIQIFEYLDVSGRACLALTCKDNARIAVEHNLLKSFDSADELTDAMDEFFVLCDLDLGRSIQKKFCVQCGLYRSCNKDFWRQRAHADIDKIGGITAKRWRSEASRWGVDMLINCWLTRDLALIRQAGINCRVCPECILNQHLAGDLPGAT